MPSGRLEGASVAECEQGVGPRLCDERPKGRGCVDSSVSNDSRTVFVKFVWILFGRIHLD